VSQNYQRRTANGAVILIAKAVRNRCKMRRPNNTHTKMTEQIKLTISDCGRGDLKEIAVEQVGRKTKFIQYADSDYKRNGELKASWFKANGFRGRLFIYDAELGSAYFVTV
jgi:hypothetical protein